MLKKLAALGHLETPVPMEFKVFKENKAPSRRRSGCNRTYR